MWSGHRQCVPLRSVEREHEPRRRTCWKTCCAYADWVWEHWGQSGADTARQAETNPADPASHPASEPTASTQHYQFIEAGNFDNDNDYDKLRLLHFTR